VLADFAILDGQELSRPVLLVSWTRHAISEVSLHDLATGPLAQGLAMQEAAGWLGSSQASVDRRWDLAVHALLVGLGRASPVGAAQGATTTKGRPSSRRSF
jgi:hypothetical protein